MSTEVGHISDMLQATTAERDAAHEAAQHADQPDPRHRRRGPGPLDRAGPLARPGVPGALPHGRRLRRLGHPDRPAGRRHHHPRVGHHDARQGRRDRQAAALGRDARLDLGDQLRQDRHPHAQPDDRRPDGRGRPPLLGHRRGLLDERTDHAASAGETEVPPRSLHAADGARRRCRRQGRRPRRRPHRGRAGRARRQGRHRSRPRPASATRAWPRSPSTPPTSSWRPSTA